MKRILIIDRAHMLESLLHATFTEDHEAVVVETGEQALEELEHHHVDAVLVNLMTPVSDGARFIRGLGVHHLAIPVILASGERDIARLALALEPTRAEMAPATILGTGLWHAAPAAA